MGRTCAVTAAGITLGISGNLLLRTTPWGINLTIWTLIFIVLAFLLAGSLQIEFSREAACLAVPVAFFAAAFALRDSNTLKFLNGMGIAATAALAAMRGRRGSLGIGGTLEYTVGFLAEWLKGPQSFIDDIRGADFSNWWPLPHLSFRSCSCWTGCWFR